MSIDTEPHQGCRPVESGVKCRFDLVVQREVQNIAAVRADQVMMMLAQVFGQFVAGELVSSDHPGDSPDLFEDGEVTVGTRLREGSVTREDLGDGQRTFSGLQDRDYTPSTTRVPLAGFAQQSGDFVVDFGVEHTSSVAQLRMSENECRADPMSMSVVRVVENELITHADEAPTKGSSQVCLGEDVLGRADRHWLRVEK